MILYVRNKVSDVDKVDRKCSCCPTKQEGIHAKRIMGELDSRVRESSPEDRQHAEVPVLQFQ